MSAMVDVGHENTVYSRGSNILTIELLRRWQVRVDAVAALRSLVDAFHADDLPSIKPLIPSLLNQLFALMAEVGAAGHPHHLAAATLAQHAPVPGWRG